MTEQNFLTDNIRHLCAINGVSIPKLAKRIGIENSTLYRIVNGTVRPQSRTLRGIADVFGTDTLSLQTADLKETIKEPSATDFDADPEKPVTEADKFLPVGNPEAPTETGEVIPLVRFPNAERFEPTMIRYFTQDHDLPKDLTGYEIERWIRVPYGVKGDRLVAVRMVGDAMTPTVLPGDLVIVSGFDAKVFEGASHKVESGELILAKIKVNGQAVVTVRRARRDDFGVLVAAADSPCSEGATTLSDIIGKVVGVVRTF